MTGGHKVVQSVCDWLCKSKKALFISSCLISRGKNKTNAAFNKNLIHPLAGSKCNYSLYAWSLGRRPVLQTSSGKCLIRLFYQHYKTSDQAAQRPSRVVPNNVEPEETQRCLRSQAPLSAETGGTAHTAQAADGLIPSHQHTATQPARKLWGWETKDGPLTLWK